jgi:hypothetical protein
MAKLKLGAIAEDKPVKVTHELPAGVHRDLIAYAEALVRVNFPNKVRGSVRRAASERFPGRGFRCPFANKLNSSTRLVHCRPAIVGKQKSMRRQSHTNQSVYDRQEEGLRPASLPEG